MSVPLKTKWACVSPTGSFVQRKMLRYFQARDTWYVSRQAAHPIATSRGLVQTVALEDVLHSDRTHVYIATPTSTHESLVMACVRAGKNVLVEKTPATCSLRFAEILRQADKSGVSVEIACQCYQKLMVLRPMVSAGIRYAKCVMNLPMGGKHPNPVWDVAWYGLLVGQLLAGNHTFMVREASFHDSKWTVYFEYPRFEYELEFSVDAEFEQSLTVQSFRRTETPMGRHLKRRWDRPFTSYDEDTIYGSSISRFEAGNVCVLPLIGSALPHFEWLDAQVRKDSSNVHVPG